MLSEKYSNVFQMVELKGCVVLSASQNGTESTNDNQGDKLKVSLSIFIFQHSSGVMCNMHRMLVATLYMKIPLCKPEKEGFCNILNISVPCSM